jgi:hypothetical protein
MSAIFAVMGLAAIVAVSSAADTDVIAQAKVESQAFVQAFNDHNPARVGALLVETADFAFLQGSSLDNMQFGLIVGRDRIRETLETFFQICPSAKVSHTVRTARMITPDVMLSDEDFEISGLPADSGPIKGQCVVIRIKVDGTWKITAERNVSKAPPQKP